jgi:hypothetical protein
MHWHGGLDCCSGRICFGLLQCLYAESLAARSFQLLVGAEGVSRPSLRMREVEGSFDALSPNFSMSAPEKQGHDICTCRPTQLDPATKPALPMQDQLAHVSPCGLIFQLVRASQILQQPGALRLAFSAM